MSEPLYFTVTNTQGEREKIFSALKKRGYQLLTTNATIAHVNDAYPQQTWCYVEVNTKNGIIDLRQTPPQNEFALAVSRADLMSLPPVPKTNISAPNKADTGLDLPEAARYKIMYQKEDGKTCKYEISNPVSANAKTITCYCFGKGIRSFQRTRIQSIQKLA